MYLGDFDPSVAVPIVGSDRITQGLSPTTMHIDPVSGLPMSEAMAAPVAVVQPASSNMSLWLIAALALVAWYGWEHGWFRGLFGGEAERQLSSKGE